MAESVSLSQCEKCGMLSDEMRQFEVEHISDYRFEKWIEAVAALEARIKELEAPRRDYFIQRKQARENAVEGNNES